MVTPPRGVGDTWWLGIPIIPLWNYEYEHPLGETLIVEIWWLGDYEKDYEKDVLTYCDILIHIEYPIPFRKASKTSKLNLRPSVDQEELRPLGLSKDGTSLDDWKLVTCIYNYTYIYMFFFSHLRIIHIYVFYVSNFSIIIYNYI